MIDKLTDILIDMDGVLVDFVGGICAAHGITSPYMHENNDGEYDIAKLSGLPAEEFWKPCLDADFWDSLYPTSDGRQILSAACQVVGANHVYIATSPTLGSGSPAGKTRWVEQCLPEFSRRLIIGPCKHLMANPKRLLLDDSDHQCAAFRNSGGNTILVPRPWNAEHRVSASALGYVTVRLQEGWW